MKEEEKKKNQKEKKKKEENKNKQTDFSELTTTEETWYSATMIYLKKMVLQEEIVERLENRIKELEKKKEKDNGKAAFTWYCEINGEISGLQRLLESLP